jgi:hypothetical protein
VLERRRAAHVCAIATHSGPRRFQRDLVEPARLRVDAAVDAREFLFQHDVLVALGKPLVIGVLEGLESAHHLAMRHHGVERNARLGLKFIVGIDIHWLLL